MSLLDERLSNGLSQLADAAPEAHGDLDQVKRIGRRRVLVGRVGGVLAASLLAIAMVGSALAVRSWTTDSPVGDETPSTPVTSTSLDAAVSTSVPEVATPVSEGAATTTPGPVPAELEMVWDRVANFNESWFTSVADGGPVLVVGGYTRGTVSGEFQTDAAVWVSEDVTDWQRIDLAGDLDSAGESYISEVATTPDGFVALGYDGADRIVWASPDGYEWRVVDGWPYVSMSGPTGGTWVSVDGIEWHVYEAPVGNVTAYDVVAGGPGYVAVGSDVASWDPFEARTSIWVSTDGMSWQRLDDKAVGSDGHFERVAAGPNGSPLIAFGWEATFISDNGIDWSEAATSTDLPPPASEAAFSHDAIVITGTAFEGTTANVWLSNDGGITMHRLDADVFKGNQTDMSDIIVTGNRIIAVGGDIAGMQGHLNGGHPIVGPLATGAIWIGEWSN